MGAGRAPRGCSYERRDLADKVAATSITDAPAARQSPRLATAETLGPTCTAGLACIGWAAPYLGFRNKSSGASALESPEKGLCVGRRPCLSRRSCAQVGLNPVARIYKNLLNPSQNVGCLCTPPYLGVNCD